jgi:hypothetical protein
MSLSEASEMALDFIYQQQVNQILMNNQLQVAYLVTALLEDLQNGKSTVHACNILRDIKDILAVEVIL